MFLVFFFFSSRRRHTSCALVTGVQTCALPIWAILDLRLHRLTALGRDEIGNELHGLANNIAEYLAILGDRVKLYAVMREEFEAIRDEFATPRRSTIAPAADGIEDEDLIEHEDMVEIGRAHV